MLDAALESTALSSLTPVDGFAASRVKQDR
jgi:hypothetical protein